MIDSLQLTWLSMTISRSNLRPESGPTFEIRGGVFPSAQGEQRGRNLGILRGNIEVLDMGEKIRIFRELDTRSSGEDV